MVGEFLAAAAAVVSALKKNRDNEIAQQYAVNDAAQDLWDKRNAAVQAKIDRANGVDPTGHAFQDAQDRLHLKAMNSPVPQDWTPLVKAVGTGAQAIYKQGRGGSSSVGDLAGDSERPELGDTVDDALARYDAQTAGGGGGGGGVGDGWIPISSEARENPNRSVDDALDVFDEYERRRRSRTL